MKDLRDVRVDLSTIRRPQCQWCDIDTEVFDQLRALAIELLDELEGARRLSESMVARVHDGMPPA